MKNSSANEACITVRIRRTHFNAKTLGLGVKYIQIQITGVNRVFVMVFTNKYDLNLLCKATCCTFGLKFSY